MSHTYTGGIPDHTGFFWGYIADTTNVNSVESIKKDGKKYYLMYFDYTDELNAYYQFFGYSREYTDFEVLSEFKFSEPLTP